MKKLTVLGVMVVAIFSLALAGCNKKAATTKESSKVTTSQSSKKGSKPTTSSRVLETSEAAQRNGETTNDSNGQAVAAGVKIWDVSYDATVNKIYGKTASNAKVYVTVPADTSVNGGEFVADGEGNFTIIGPKQGAVNQLIAYSDTGEQSEPYDIDIPSQGTDDSLALSSIVYDPVANQLTAKTAPNANVMVSVANDPSVNGGTFKADANGNVTVVGLKRGVSNRLQATLGDKTGEPYVIDVPE